MSGYRFETSSGSASQSSSWIQFPSSGSMTAIRTRLVTTLTSGSAKASSTRNAMVTRIALASSRCSSWGCWSRTACRRISSGSSSPSSSWATRSGSSFRCEDWISCRYATQIGFASSLGFVMEILMKSASLLKLCHHASSSQKQ